MGILRLFALCGFGLLGALVTAGLAVAQSTSGGWHPDWEMIDEDVFPAPIRIPTAAATRTDGADLAPRRSQQSVRPSWTANADFLALVRNDEHQISFNTFPGIETVEMQSDSISGLRLSVSRSADQPDGQSQTGVWEGSFLFAQDENSYPIASQEWVVTSRLTTAEFNGGVESRVFGVRTRLTAGGRYAHVADEYDRYLGFPRTFDDDFVATQNHAGYAQGKLAMQWQRGRWSVDASLAGGAGVSVSHQEGDVFSSPTVTAYEADQWSLSILVEASAKARVRLFSQTHLQFGLDGLSLSEMAVSRRSLGGEGDLDDARYLGLTIGVQQCF